MAAAHAESLTAARTSVAPTRRGKERHNRPLVAARKLAARAGRSTSKKDPERTLPVSAVTPLQGWMTSVKARIGSSSQTRMCDLTWNEA